METDAFNAYHAGNNLQQIVILPYSVPFPPVAQMLRSLVAELLQALPT